MYQSSWRPHDAPYTHSLTKPRSRSAFILHTAVWHSPHSLNTHLYYCLSRLPIADNSYPMATMASGGYPANQPDTIENPLYAEHKMGRLGSSSTEPHVSYLPSLNMNDLNSQVGLFKPPAGVELHAGKVTVERESGR